MNTKLRSIINSMQETYLSSNVPWILGFSGGKDSSALIKLAYLAVKQAKKKHKPIIVVYCDTGVEIPLIRNLVIETLNKLKQEAKQDGVPIEIHISEPNIEDRYFVKVIGRGYPPPTNKFRWCTDKLRIKPIQQLLKSVSYENSIILLGMRKNESQERQRTLQSYRINKSLFFRQDGNAESTIYAPMYNFTTNEVWRIIVKFESPKCIDVNKLTYLYGSSHGDCPLIRSSKDNPCTKGRFGCWTCTVIRRDKAMENLVDRGEKELLPLLGFRNWLAHIREKQKYRCTKRRNNSQGPGPFTLEARRIILTALLIANEQSPWKLIDEEEIKMIKQLWNKDRNDPNYLSIERS